MSNLQRIPFHQDTILAITDERTGKHYVLPKPMVEMFGLSWQGQLEKLKKNQLFAKGIKVIFIPSAGGEQETVVLERRLVHAWLLSIDAGRVREQFRDKLLRYQEECADVLDKYFSGAMQPSLPARTVEQDLAFVDKVRDFLESLGKLEERDKLMLADKAKTLLIGQAAVAQMTATPHGFYVAERINQLGYHLSRAQETKIMPSLSKSIAREYRRKHGKEPLQNDRYVDGAVRKVNWYLSAEAEWIDVLIQKVMVAANLSIGSEE